MKIINLLTVLLSDALNSLVCSLRGVTGRKIRYLYYKNKFNSCGSNVYIDHNVSFLNIENINVGNNVWFAPNSIITAPTKTEFQKTGKKFIFSDDYNPDIHGALTIGNNVGIGAFCTIQAIGGMQIMNDVTISDYSRVLSFTHLPYDPDDPTVVVGASGINSKQNVCAVNPLVLDENCWLGMGSTVIGASIGKNSMVMVNCVVTNDVGPNVCVQGTGHVVRKRFENL